MKKYIPHVLMISLYSLGSFAQSMDDVLHFVRPELKGTARYVGMGGAFNALGGDLSAVGDNPAAAAVFLNSEVGLTLNLLENKNTANYFGNSNDVESESIQLDQFGVVFMLYNNDGNDFTKLSLAYNHKKEQIFDNKFNAIGVNSNRSLEDYFLAFANGIPYSDIKTYDDERLSDSYRYLGENRGFSSQQAFLGFQSYMINPVELDDDNTQYVSNSNPQGQAVNHNYFVTQTGKNSKNSITLASQYKQNLYLGINLNSHQTRLRRIYNLIENNYGSGSTFNYSEFENDLLTVGEGFSFQLGLIYKPQKNIRMGLSYQSPVWYQMSDELLQTLITSKDNGTDTIDPQIINFYEYDFSTPSVLSGGLAYVFGTKGLISLQYDRVNFQNISFDIKNGDANFINQNKKIKNSLKSAGTLKLGAEYRIDRLSLRGGYFKRQNFNQSAQDVCIGMSSGLSYDFGGSVLSFALSKVEYERSESMYQEGLTDFIQLKNNQLQFLVSYALKL